MFSKIKGWWDYSRIIFINVVGGAFIIVWNSLPDLIMLAGGQDWSVLFPPKIAAFVSLGVGVASVILRLKTYSPPGATLLDKEVIKASLELTPSSIVAEGKDLDVGDNKETV